MAAPDIAALGQEIYRQLFELQEEDPKQVFHQADIFDLGVLPDDAEGKDDVMLALQVLQKLADEKLLKVVHHEGMGWKIRTEDEAKKYRGLSSDEEIVYSHIDEANDEGIWMRNIKIRSGLHEAVIAAALKKLKTRNMIQDMKSVEHPARKMYIKSNLSPSERATGGPWYTDGELDEDFIEMVMKILFDYISKRTFYFSKSYGPPSKTPKKVVRKMSPEEARAKRDQVLGAEEEMDEKTTRMIAYEKHLPMPAGYQKYPTLDELTVWIEKGNYFSQTLTANELQQLLDVMVFDDRIEMVVTGEGKAYRALRRSLLSEDDRGSVLTEAPCGRCPVFDLCEEGGPVGPSNCEYFNDWLGL